MNAASRMIIALLAPLLAVLAMLVPLSAMANEHGGGGAPEPTVFTVNLGKDNYLQFGLIFEAATPEAAQLLASYKPKVQHEIILLLSGKDSNTLRSLQGKKELIEEIVALTNRIIGENEETGIKEVLFSKFLIQ